MDVSVRYVQGNWVGKLGTDIVTIPKGPNGTITINVATILQSEKFFLPRVNWQGIMGLAYKTLAMVKFLFSVPASITLIFYTLMYPP